MSQKSKRVYIDYEAPEIAIIRMEDSTGKNGLNGAFIDDFTRCIEAIKSDERGRVVILAGLPDVFCSGADLATLKGMCLNELKPVDIVLSRMILNLPIPVVSSVEGHAVGGGLAVGLCADMVVLAEESRYGCSFMNMGFTPGMGITRLIEHYVAPSLAHEMLFTGTFYKGKEFKGKSSFNYILPKSEVWEKALALARAMAEKPRPSLVLLKKYLSMERRKIFEETLTLESMMHEISLHQESMVTLIEESYIKY